MMMMEYDDKFVLEHLQSYSGHRTRITEIDYDSGTRRVEVDKTTHRIRFESETESQVTLVIEPKEEN